MSISIVDAFIVMFIILGGIVGFKQGAIKTGTRYIGTLAIVIISFILKDPLTVFLYEKLPFFNFFGFIEGIDSINILLYQLIAFLLIFITLTFILRVLLVVTGLIEQLLKMTIFLSIPSKILGIFVGALEYYTYIFIVLYILNMPFLNLGFINESKLGSSVLNNTPILSNNIKDTTLVYKDVWNILKNKKNKSDSEINTLVLATLLDNNLISIESAKDLVERNKIYIKDTSILEKYDENESFYKKLKEEYKINDKSKE